MLSTVRTAGFERNSIARNFAIVPWHRKNSGQVPLTVVRLQEDTNRTYYIFLDRNPAGVFVQVHKICYRKTANPIYVTHFRRVDLRRHPATL